MSRASRAAVDRYNRLANDAAFLSHNPLVPSSSSLWPFSSSKPSLRQIDLHELLVPDALRRAKDHLGRCRREGQTETVFITGWGKGSVGGQAKIKPAVEEWLGREKGIEVVQQRNKGVIAVEIGKESSCLIM
jgi:hypothetical protein